MLLVVGLAGCASASDAETAAPSPVEKPTPSPTVSGEDLFHRSCALFSQEDALFAILDGFDADDIDRINAALALAQQAGKADPGTYGAYAEEFQSFAEALGAYVAVTNDRGAGPEEAMDALSKALPPGGGVNCPDRAPDSEGLPLPDDMQQPPVE